MDGEQHPAADEQSDRQPEAGQDDLQGERPDAAAASATDPETEALPAPEPRTQRTSNGLPTEEIIGWILRVGVAASAICIALGALLLLVSHDTGYGSQSFSNAGQLLQYSSGAGGRFPTTPGEVIAGLAQFKPYALIALGLLLLIATPVVRVAASIAIFLLERDYAYVLITAIVLLILIVSFLLGKAG